MAPVVALSPAELKDLGVRFFDAMNARDYGAAGDIYAAEAIYESPGLRAPGRLTGRDNIIRYFTTVLEDDDFQLAILEQFTGVNLVVTRSTSEGRTFVDVFKVNNDAQIVEHLEVAPEASPIDPG